jgi:hypothetical protein
MTLEVPNKDEGDTYWVATVVMAAGQLLRLRYEGFNEDSAHDFWLDACAADLHQLGWCQANDKQYSPPEGDFNSSVQYALSERFLFSVVKSAVSDWEELQTKLKTEQAQSTDIAENKVCLQ